MSKYKDLVYMVMDQLKIISDDSIITEDHVIFLLSKYRAFLIKQQYLDKGQSVPEIYYQTLCLDLERYNFYDNKCIGNTYLRTTKKVPTTLSGTSVKVYPKDFYEGNIQYVNRERMKYVGTNKYLQNILYTSQLTDGHFYFTSSNNQFIFLKKIRITGVFEDTEAAAELECDSEDEEACDILDKTFPIEDSLIPMLIELVVKILSGVKYQPADRRNNASDDLAELVNYLRNNTKGELAQALE